MSDYEYNIEYINHSHDAEQSVVGGILLISKENEYKIGEVLGLLKPSDFYHEAHQTIFSVYQTLFDDGKAIDVVTVQGVLSSIGKLESCGGLPYLAQLAQNTPSSANITYYASIVRGKAKERYTVDLARSMTDCIYSTSYSTSDEKVNAALSLVSHIDDDDETEKTYGDYNREFINELERRSQQKGMTGYSTGFDDLDKRYSGLQKSHLAVLAARPAQGKTALALNMAKSVAKEKAVLIFSLEMSGGELVERIYSSYGVNAQSLKKGDLSCNNTNAALTAAAQQAKNLNIIIDDRGGLKPEQVRAKALKEKRKNGELGLIVIDYIQLMTVNKSNGLTEDVTKISNSLKALAKEIDCPVLALSQLSRDVEKRTNKRPQMSDLRQSGAIEQDADLIMFLYRDDYYAAMENRESNAPDVCEVITGKYRHGEVGTDYLRTELHFMRFGNLDNYQPEEQSFGGIAGYE